VKLSINLVSFPAFFIFIDPFSLCLSFLGLAGNWVWVKNINLVNKKKIQTF
jgi:hypothetical protein